MDIAPAAHVLFKADEFLLGHPPSVSAADGIRIMRDRLSLLKLQLQVADKSPDELYVQSLKEEIADTLRRLSEYDVLFASGSN